MAGSLNTTIIVAVIIVVAVILLSVFMWFYIDEGEIFPPDEKVTLNLASPSVMTRDIANVTHWDAVLNINKITPRESLVPWMSIQVIIKTADGSVLVPIATLLIDDPSSYDDAANGWVDVEAWYVEISSNVFVDAGEAFKITGMDDRYEGAFVEITYLGDRIGSITLPTNFP